MYKYLKSYKQYPAGTLVIGKNYSLWERLKYWLKRKKRTCNTVFMLSKSTNIKIQKWFFLRDDFYLLIPKKPYTKQEITKLNKIINSCKTKEDYFTLVNILRPYTVDIKGPLEQLKTNQDYKMFYLFSEPFQEVIR